MDYKTGDLCWAKLKGYPSWPGKIMDNPNSEKIRYQRKERLRHYIYFFGSNNYAWVNAKKIKPNSEKAIKEASETKTLQKAVQELKKEMVEGNYYYRQGIIRKCQVRINRLSVDFSELKESNSFTQNKTLALKLGSRKSIEPLKNIQKLDDTILNMGNMISDTRDKSADYQEMMPKKFGFIGHGEIGKEILKNVLKSKCNVTIWAQTSIEYDLSDVYNKTYSFLELITSCDIILCYIDSKDNAQSILKGDQSILESFITYPSQGKGFALLANVDLQDYAETAVKIQASGARYIGASLIGSKTQASSGEILILCSGNRSLYNDCKAAFISYQRIKYLGPDTELAPKCHTIIGLLLNSVSKSYKETIRLIQSLGLPLQIFKCLLKTLFNENSLDNFCDDSFEKKFRQDDRVRFFLEELNLKTLLAVNFSK